MRAFRAATCIHSEGREAKRPESQRCLKDERDLQRREGVEREVIDESRD